MEKQDNYEEFNIPLDDLKVYISNKPKQYFSIATKRYSDFIHLLAKKVKNVKGELILFFRANNENAFNKIIIDLSNMEELKAYKIHLQKSTKRMYCADAYEF